MGIAPSNSLTLKAAMQDLIVIAITLGFFALAAGYVRGCELM
jgi:hypothetical protein